MCEYDHTPEASGTISLKSAAKSKAGGTSNSNERRPKIRLAETRVRTVQHIELGTPERLRAREMVLLPMFMKTNH